MNHQTPTSLNRHKTNVGAGLPAIQAPRCISYTLVMLSQASQLPHKPAPTLLTAIQISLMWSR
ncbi:hypothetical protein C7U57_00075 [Pseudomonas sp. R9.37]|nr:hypothetical protein C7U57_00075 [Pseudomonas sp. R9.37]